MKSNKTVVTVLTLLFVCVLTSVTLLTGAWFSDSVSKEVQITLGNAVTIKTDGTFKDSTVMPGSEVEFISVVAQADENTSNMYIRAYLTIEGSAGDLLQIVSAGDNWVKYGDYFYYTEQTELSSTSILSQLKILSAGISASELTVIATVTENATEETLTPTSNVKCEVVFQSIQSANTGDFTIDEMVNSWNDKAE